MPGIVSLLIDEVLTPYYIFQYFSILLWVIFEHYYNYSLAIIVITVFSISSEINDNLKSRQKIKQMAEFRCKVTVRRQGKDIIIQSNELVPSDLVVLMEDFDQTDGMQLPCDLVLIKG